MKHSGQTPRATIRRLPERGHYDKQTLYKILDDGLICHIGIVEDGQPFVLPTIHARMGDTVVLHGSTGSRLLKTVRNGSPLCLTVTHLDGLVLARSVFHHSMNYRSVVLFGKGRAVEDPEEKMNALRTLVEHIVPGRWEDARKPNEREMKQTTVIAIPIDEASAKIRTGPPGDEEEDYALPVWAGVLPLRQTFGPADPDPRLLRGISLPEYLLRALR